MRILQLHNVHQTVGGANVVIERERSLLKNAGHDVRSFFVESSEYLTGPKARQFSAVIWNPAANRGVKRAIAAQNTDVVHLHTPFPFMSPSVVRAAKQMEVPVVMTSHSFRIPCIAATLRRDGRECHDCVGATIPLAAVRHRCYHDSLAASAALALSSTLHHHTGTFGSGIDRHLALTSYMKDVLVRDGIADDRVVIHPNFIPDPGRSNHQQPRSGAVFLGRLVPEKGVETLVEAWRRLGVDAPPLRIVGEGPERQRLEAAAPSTVSFVGKIPNERVADELARAEVLVFPSEWPEGLGLSWVEALASETPVLYSDIGNFTELLDEARCGHGFTTGSSDSLAKVVDVLFCSTNAERRSLGRAGRRFYETHFTPDAALKRLERVYADVQNVAP